LLLLRCVSSVSTSPFLLLLLLLLLTHCCQLHGTLFLLLS
jgi:hypothetical protein